MSTLFLESSAVLQVVFHETRRDEVLSRIHTARNMIASRLLRVECERAVIRCSLDPSIAASRIPEMRRELALLWPKISFIEISHSICDEAGRISPNSFLRTLDAIHLATFHRMKEATPDIEMLSFDARIRAALGME